MERLKSFFKEVSSRWSYRCITMWRGKFKLGHLITRKHRSACATYWFNLKIWDSILWLPFWTMLLKRICKASVMVFSNRVIKSLSQKNANWIMLLFKFHHMRPKLQLWDDHLAKYYISLYGNIYDRS